MLKRMDINRLANYATTICSIDDYMMVVYHHTVIVKWNKDTITLNKGEYQTITTKRKMNQTSNQFHLGYRVYQEDYNWYVEFKGNVSEFWGEWIKLYR